MALYVIAFHVLYHADAVECSINSHCDDYNDCTVGTFVVFHTAASFGVRQLNARGTASDRSFACVLCKHLGFYCTSWYIILAYDVTDSCDTRGKSRGECDYVRIYDTGCCLWDDDVCKFHGRLYHTRCCSGTCMSNGRCAGK